LQFDPGSFPRCENRLHRFNYDRDLRFSLACIENVDQFRSELPSLALIAGLA